MGMPEIQRLHFAQLIRLFGVSNTMDNARLLQEEQDLKRDSEEGIVPSRDDLRSSRRSISLKLSLLANGVLLVVCAFFLMQTPRSREEPFVQRIYCKPFE